MNLIRAAWLVAAKEMRVERRSGEVVVSSGLLAVLIAVIGSFSLYLDPASAAQAAPGVLWMAIAFAGIVAMNRSWGRERDHQVVQALLLAPIPRAAIYLGKCASTLVLLAFIELILVTLVGVLFHLDLWPLLSMLLPLLFFGTLGFCAAGNLFAAMSIRSGTRDLALAVVVFPVIAPALLCAVVGTRELLQAAPPQHVWGWMRILVGFDLLTIAASLWLFEIVLADGG
jgi:heme exporter protein B